MAPRGIVRGPDGQPAARNPFLPVVSMLSCLVLMVSLPLETWVRFFVWLGIGLVIYFLFGKKHSEFAAGTRRG